MPSPIADEYRQLPAVVAAPGQPVASSIGQRLIANQLALYEGITDQPPVGVASQTVIGHAHTGDGDGRSIPRAVFAAVWAVPLGDSIGTTSPTEYDFNTGAAPGISWVSPAGMANTHNTPGWVQGGSGIDTDRGNIIMACPLRLRAGCKGVHVDMWRGTRIGTDPNAADTVTWYVELRPLIYGDTGDSDVRDAASQAITANENAQWMAFPDGITVVGANSGADYLACAPTAGDRLSMDSTFILYIGIKPSSNANADGSPSGAGLYGVCIYEVPAEV